MPANNLKNLGLALLLLLTVFCTPHAHAADSVKIEKPPDWAVDLAIPKVNPGHAGQAQNGIYYLLSDTQIRVLPDRHDSYERVAYQIMDRAGLEQGARIEQSFDPANATLSFNYVRIIRDGKAIDALVPKDILVLRREQGLERGVYDGDLTAHIEMKDLRVGDIVEFATTRQQRTPLWPKDFFGGAELSWSVPIGVERYRLIWPKDRPLSIQSTRAGLTPVIAETGDSRIYEWLVRDPEPTPFENNLPDGVSIFDWLRLSTMESWPEVSRWAFQLYNRPNDLPADWVAKVDEIANAHPDPADRITEALRLVQDTIRYVSIAIDAGSYIPRPAATIVHDGFGDCKDKSTLLVATLRRLGVEAYPALTDIDAGQALVGRLPSVRSFDHMIVLVRQNGQNHWLDPTLSHQGGRFPAIYVPRYGFALPIMEAGSDLLPVTFPKSGSATIASIEHFTIDPATAKYTLRAYSVFQEDEADAIRTKLSEKGRDKFNRENLDYYKKFYPDLTADGLPTVDDDRDLNRIALTEPYKFAGKPQGFDKYTPFLPSYLRGFFTGLPGNRLYPYAIDPDIHRRDTVLIDAPGVETANIKDETLDNRQFSYSRVVDRKRDQISLDFYFRIKDRQVPLADYVGFREAADRLNNSTYNTISLKNAQANAPHRGARAKERYKLAAIVIGALAAVGILIGSLRYGLRADRDYAERGVYFPVSLPKFLALQVVTLGVYGQFWIWKCWRWVRIHDRRDIRPFWRALFTYFYWNSLFQNIRKRNLAVALPRWLGLASLAVYIALLSAPRLPPLQGSVAAIAPLLLSIFCLVPMVVGVNRLNAANPEALRRNSQINGWNILAFVLGGTLYSLMAIGLAVMAFRSIADD